MRSNIFNTEHLDNREYVLMSNNRTELDIIPSEYVLEYTSKLDDVSTLRIEIPRYVMRGEQRIEYPLYNKLYGKQFIVVRKDGINLERFIIDAITEEITAENSKKTFTANSYENILKNRACMINEGMTRQLYKKPNETFDVADGILNIFEQQTGWTVDYANSDESAFVERVEENIIKEIDIFKGTKVWQKVFKNHTLFDIDITVPSESGFALNFDITWNNITVTDGNGNPFKADSIIHTFTNLYTGVKHIKATYTSDATERYGMTYDLILDDDNHITQTFAFVNCKELQLQVEGIKLNYITSQTQKRDMAKYRFLEHQSTYWYQYLKTTVQEAYNCYIFFDSFNKTITIRDKSSYTSGWKGFYLDFDNLLTKITKTPKVDDLCTRLWIESNNVDITEVNPLGTSYLEDYSYFRNNGSMSPELCNALDRYKARLDELQALWMTIKNEKNSVDQQCIKKNSQLISLNSQLKTKNDLLTAYIKAKDKANQERIAAEISALETQIASTTSAIQQLEEQSATLLERMQEIGRQMSKENATDGQGRIFTYTQNGQQINLLDELEDFTLEQTYADDVHTKANRLYEYAQELMKEKAKLTYSFSLEHNDLVKGIKHPLGWQWFIELGAKVELNDKDIADADGFVTIYAYTYSPKENKISNVDFNNNTKVIEAVKGISAIGKLVHQTASMTDFWKSTWRDSVQNNIVVSDIRKNGLDLAANTVRGGTTVNKVSMTEAGLFVIDANNENNQIYVGASLIAVTDDKWVHAKTAIDNSGVIADTIVGRLILGENLWISNEDGSFNIKPNGLTIFDKNHVERIQMGLNNENNPYFQLGRENDGNFLIFDDRGQLNIQASAFKIKVGGTTENPTFDSVISQGQASKIIKNEIGQIIIPTRNYALDSLRGYTIVGDSSGDKAFKLCDLSQNQQVFNGKKTAISFSWEYVDGTATSSFYIRTGGNHNQRLTETFIISPSLHSGRYNTVNTITVDAEVFDTLELVASNLHGKIIISLLKFEINDNMTTWTQAPEDGQEAYTILLSNETQIISVNKNLHPLADETFETDVLVYQGAVLQENFTIENLQSVGDIQATVTGHKISYSVKRDTPLTELKGRFDFTIKVDGQEFKKSWAWVAVKQVTEGYIMVTGDQIFKYSNNFDGEPSPKVLTLNVNRYDLDAVGKWQYKNSNGEWIDWVETREVTTSDTLIIKPNDKMYADDNVKTMQVRYIINQTYDEFTTYKVSDGSNGNEGSSSFLHIRYSANQDGLNMTVQPQPDSKYIGTYVSTTSVASDNPNDYTWVLIKGQDGLPGNDGEDGTSSYFHVKYSNDGETFTENNGEVVGSWIGTYVDYNELDSNVFSDYNWVKYVGRDGIDGNHAEYVKVSGEQVFKYTGGFHTIPTPTSITIRSTVYNFTDPSYEWSYKRSGDAEWTIIEGQTTSNLVLSHNNSEIFTNMAVTNVTIRCRAYTAYDEAFDEITIAKIRDGVDGVSIVQIQEQYYLSTSQQELMNGQWFDDVAPTWETGKYIWTRTEFTYSDGTTKTTSAICVTGRDGLNGGVSVSKVDVFYYQSDSNSELVNGKWQTTAPAWANGKYVWTKTITYLDNNTQYESKPVCISGEKGQDGIDGNPGKDGVSNYFFIRYSEFEDGHDMTELPTSETKYMGTATSTENEAPTEYTSYKWTLVKGTDGRDGTDGTPGVDGSSSYLHIKYSNDGKTFTNNNGEELGKWIGTYVDTNSTDSSNFADYNWVRFIGEDGNDAKYVIVTGDQTFKYTDNYTTLVEPQEIVLTAIRYNITQQGKWQYKEVNGAWTDLGCTTEQLIVTPDMASFANGAKTLSLRYIADSCFDVMTIAKVSDGYNGTDGKDGIDGVNNYFHIRYSAIATGENMTTMPNEDSKYMGTCVTDTNEAPTDYRLYSWSLFRGNDGNDGTTIVNIKEQYYLSTSQTMLLDGEWQDSAPTWETGKYIWTRTVFSYNNNTTSTTEPICVTGRDGNDGLNGGISVSGVDTYYYQSTSATELVDGEWKTVSPVWQNGKYVWSKTVTYLDNGTQYESKPICLTGQKGNDGTDGIPGKDGEDGKTTYLHIKYSDDGETFTDNNGETIGTWIGTYVDFIEADSSNFIDYEWKKYTGEDGRDGYDAYTALLTNENHTFPCDFEGNISSDITITTTAIGYKGITPVTPTIGTIPSVTGMTITKSKNVITITAKAGKTLSDNGSIQIPITIDGKTFNKAFSWTKTKNGKNGIDGIPGVDSYFYIRYSANADGSAMTTEPQSNTMYMGSCSTTSKTAPTDYKAYKWTLIRGADGKQGAQGIQGAKGSDGKTSYLHIKYSNDGTTFSPNNGEDVGLWIGTYVDFTEADSNTFSKYTWKKYVGKDGEPGDDAYTVMLTNESHSFPADSSGKISSDVSTTTKVIAYKGLNTIKPTIGTLPTVNGLTITKQSDGVTLKITAKAGTSLALSGSFNIPITVDGKSFTKTFSFNKALQGNKGDNAKNVSLSASSQVFKSIDGGQTYAPSSITVKPTYQNVTHSKWQHSIDGGLTWIDTGTNTNGVTIDSNGFTISQSSTLFTDKVTTIVVKDVTNDSAVYDTITISRLFDVADLQIGGRNLIRKSYLQPYEAAGSFDDATNTWTLTATAGNTSKWGCGINIYAPKKILVPYGKTYIMSFEIKVPRACTWNIDVNTYPVTGDAWAGNDHDTGRKTSSKQITETDQWVKCWSKWSNTAASNTNKLDIYDSSVFGIVMKNETEDMTFQIRNVKGELGTIMTDWSPCPDDVEGNITDVQNQLDSFQSTVNNSFKDGIIQQAEAKAIEKYLQTLKAEKADVDKEYTSLYGNSSLGGTAKTNLQSAKSTLNTKHTNLINAINSAISDGKTTSTEKTNVDNKFTEYNTALGTYRQRVQEALDYISSAKVNGVVIGATNLIENSQYNDMSKWTRGSLYTIISAESDYPNNKIAHLKNTDTSKQWQSIYPKNNFLVKTGEIYTFSFDIKAIVVSSDINIRIRYYDSTKAITEKASGNIIGSSDENITDKVVLNKWVRLSRTVTIPNLTDIQHMAIGIQSTDANEYKTRNWKLEKGNKATDWSLSPNEMENAYTIILTNEAQVIPTNSSRKPTASTTYYTDIVVYQGTTQRTDYTIGTINSANGITVGKTASRVNFTTSTSTTLSADSGNFTIPITIDDKTFNKVFSWSCSKQGSKGDKGESGNDAYTVILTNENHTFNAEQNGNIASAISTSTKVIAYKGATSVTPTIGTLPSVGGLTLSKASDGVTINIKANTGTSLANNGKIDIPITVDGKSFTKVFSWSKVNKGANAYSASISASSQVFKSMDGGKTYTPNTITLTPILQNLTYGSWKYSTNGGSSWNEFSSSVSGWSISKGVLTINKNCSLFTNSVSSITLKLVTNNSSYYDTMTVIKINDIGEIQLGTRNYLLKTSKSITINGMNTSNQCTQMYGVVGGTDHVLAGKQVTMSFEFSVSPGSTGTFKIQTNGTYASPATSGSWIALSDSINVANNSGGKIAKTITIPEDNAKRFSGIQVRMDSFTGDLTISKAKLEIGNIATDWSQALEDIATDIEKAKNDAISSANGTLNSTIENYYTKTETDSQIDATKEEISLKVSSLKTEVMNATYTNLLDNSDFLILDGGFPRGYSSYTYGDSSVAISDWVLQGAKAIKISSSGKTDYHWIALFSPFVSTIEGQQFTASAWVATNSYSNVDEGCLIEIEWYGNDGNRISTNAYPFYPKVDTWERVAVTGWSPNGTARARVRISVQQNGELYATRLMLQTGEIATAWTKGGDFENISDRLSYAEQKITDDAITSTVAQNFYTKTETENAITSKGYATSSQVQQTANDITFKFSQSGGYNFVRNGNPKPWHEENWWTSGNGWWYRGASDLGVQTHDTNEAYAGCATFKVHPGTTYSFSCWLMAEVNTNGADIYFIGSANDDGAYTQVHHLYNGGGDNLWVNVKRTFTTDSNINYGFIRIDNNGRRDTSAEGSTVVFFSEVQLVKGWECYPQWSPNPNEVYDGIVQIDKNGLKVTSSDFGGYTHITSSGFYLNNGSRDIFSATRDGLKVFSDPNTSINGDVIRSGNIVANNGDLTFDLNGGKLYYKYAYNPVGFLGITDGNSFFLSTAAKGWCMNSDYGSFSSMGAKSVNGGNYVPYLTVTSGGVSNYNAGIFMSMPMTFGRANGVNMIIKDTLELSSKASGAGIFNPKIVWRGTDVVSGAALFPRSTGDRIDIYTTGDSNTSNIYLRLADDTKTFFNITCNHYTYGHQSIASFRYTESIDGYGIDFYRALNMHNYNLGNVALKNAKSVQTASLALLDDVATVQTASPTAMRALDNGIEETQATITQHIATSINKTVTFNGTELVENLAEYIELPQDFLMCVDIQVTLTPNKLCRFAVTSKDEFGFVIETDTEGVTFDYVVIGTKMDGTLFASLHDVEPDTKPVIDEEEEFVKFPNDNLMLPKEFIDKGYTTFADATEEEMEAIKIEQVFGSPVGENNKNKE